MWSCSLYFAQFKNDILRSDLGLLIGSAKSARDLNMYAAVDFIERQLCYEAITSYSDCFANKRLGEGFY